MKHFNILLVFIFLINQSCCFYCNDDDGSIVNSSHYEPVYASRTELNNSIQLKSAQDIINSGKIYVIEDLLFVGEEREGFHIFDNSNPQDPKKIKFLKVIGATDLAIRDNILYVNQVTDLVALNYDKENQTVTLTKRIENTFPVLISPDGYHDLDTPQNSIVINWKLKL